MPRPPAARNHDEETLTDALALYAMFGAIDPAINTGRIADLLKAASAQNNRTLENSLDALRNIFGFNEATPTEDRESFYNNLYTLQTNPLFQSVANSNVGPNATEGRIVSLLGMDARQLAAQAKSDFGYLFALNTLSPFAAIRAGNIFSATQGELYDQWQADQSLTAADRAAGWGNFSDTYLQDRAQFLIWKNQKNINDIADDVAIRRKDNGVESYLFTDKTLKDSQGQDYSIRVAGGNVLQQVDPVHISFASDRGDSLQGGSYADHLYGGKGKDTLAGGDGNDYLEGGAEDDALRGDAGDDKLIGGNGVDTLSGGADDDTLDGGKGDDVLQGGAGNDIYIIRAGDGRDTIRDHEGRNTIIYEDASGKRTALTMPALVVAGLANTWRGQLADGGTVTITRNSPLTATLPDGTQLVVDDYHDGDFGIHLLEHQEGPVTTREIYGDLWPIAIYDPALRYNYDDLGNTVVDPGRPVEGGFDNLWGSEGNDFISTGTGGDVVLAMGGADWIRAGGADDYLDGGDGDDVIEGRSYPLPDGQAFIHSLFLGGNGNDRLYANEAVDLTEEIVIGMNTDEWNQMTGPILSGGQGEDTLVGSDYRDGLHGGLGKDVIAGRGGSDLILGDFTYEPSEPLQRDQVARRPSFPAYPRTSNAFDIAEGDNDVVFGGTGIDEIWGEGGDDWISGGDDYDFIVGGTGSDTLIGDAGDDTLIADGRYGAALPGDQDVLDGGDGNDGLISVAGDDLFFGGAGDDHISAGSGDNFAYGGDGNDEVGVTGAGRNEIYGEAGNDSLRGGTGDDYLDGGEGDDLLLGSAGADILNGGPGNDIFEPFQDDVLEGGEGDDVYKFRLGAGQNTVVDDIDSNQIALYSSEIPDWPQELILPDSIQLFLEGDLYRISYGDSGDSILLGGAEFASLQELTLRHLTGYEYVPSDNEDEDGVNIEIFNDEIFPFSQYDLQQIGSGDDDVLFGDEAFDNTMDGNTGDDVLIGTVRDDTLIGGVGNDTLDAGEGSDRYVFKPGDGIDIISDGGTNGTDTLVFGPGISPDALSLATGSLLIRIGASGDAVHVDGFDLDDAGTAGGVERFEFADGTVLSHAQLISRGFDLYGSGGADTTFGTNLVDRFHESAGDDILIGGVGDDIYYFGAGSDNDFVDDLDTAPQNLDTVVLGNGVTPENLVVQSAPGMLILAVASANDRLDIQWQPQDGYAIERVQFADGTIWDQIALESHAVPVEQAGAGATEDGEEPPSDTGSTDGGAGTPASGDATQSANGGMPTTGGGTPDAGTTSPTGSDTTQTSSGGAPPEDTGTANAGAGTQASGDATQIASGEAPPAASGTADAETTTPTGGDTTQAASGGAPSADTGTADAGAGTQTSGDTTPIGSDSTPPPNAGPTDPVAGTPTGGDTIQLAGGGTSVVDAGTPDAGSGTQAIGDAVQIGNSGAPPADNAPPNAGVENSTSGDTLQVANGGTPTADAATAGAEAATPAANEVVQIASNEAPPIDAEPPSAEAGTLSGDGITSTASTEGFAGDDAQSSEIDPTPTVDDGATASQNSQTVAVQRQQDALADAILMSGAIDSPAAPVSPRNAAKPAQYFGAPPGGEQAVSAPSVVSFFTALQPVQPSPQTWLDNWLGPRARSSDGVRENRPTPAVEDAQTSFPPESAPPGVPSDVPEMSSPEPITPEQIAQRYEDINAWLDANPGTEQGIIGASGSLPERNPFAFLGAGYTGDTGIASMAGFGQTTGMAVLPGHALQPLQGIKEGFSPLGVM